MAATLATALIPALGQATPAEAAARVSVTGPGGAGVAAASGPSTLELSGAGFQSIAGGFGGIYVLFGTVGETWRPSEGGVGGRDFLYVPDSQTKDNAGREKFVAFPGSDTADSANGGVIAADGTWSTTLAVPGPAFEVEDASGARQTIDCQAVQCGVITIGAHGVANANNESFTPVRFGGAAGGGETASGSDGAAAAAGAAAGVSAAGAPATLGVDATTAVAGHALAFTARGFTPGEQVTAVLDDGVVSVGPLTAGKYGEVASTIPLDAAMRVGSHTLTLTGAASGAAAEAMITVRRDPSVVEAAVGAERSGGAVGEAKRLGGWEIAIVVAAGVCLLVLIGSLTSAAVARRVRRRARTVGGDPTLGGEADSTLAAGAREPASSAVLEWPKAPTHRAKPRRSARSRRRPSRQDGASEAPTSPLAPVQPVGRAATAETPVHANVQGTPVTAGTGEL
jgi:hypothetical protein